MANDNTLGAPASGFGQTISFAAGVDPRATPSLDGIVNNQQERSQVQGAPALGQTQTHAIEAAPADRTLELLAQVSGVVMDRKIKEQKANAFVAGMQRAASGEAINDIKDNQPWYTSIFGESDVVEGARQYTAQAKAADAAGQIEDGMADARKLNPSEAQAYFGTIVAKNMTGDSVADAALMQGFARTLPATMRRQAKEHYAYRQEQASEAESGAILSTAQLLQKRAMDPKQTPDEYSNDAVSLIAASRPPEGRDIKSWLDARTKTMLQLAQAGSFHAVNAFKAAGMFEPLEPDQRTKIENAIDMSENRVVANKSFEYADELGRIAGQANVFSTDLNPGDTHDQLAALNERFRRETGIDRDLVTLAKGEKIISDVHTTLLREGERRIRAGEEAAAKAGGEADKVRAKALLEQGAVSAIGVGQAAAAKRSEHMGPVVDTQFRRTFDSMQLPAQANLLFSNFTGGGTGDSYVNPDIKKNYETRVKLAVGAQMPADFAQLSSAYVALRDKHPALADAYFGDQAARMELFTTTRQGSGPLTSADALAFTHAFGTQELPRPKTQGAKELKQITQAIATQHDNPDWQFWKAQREPLRPDQQELATQALATTVAKYKGMPNSDLNMSVQRAFAEHQRDNGTDMLGGFFIPGQRGQQPLTSILKTRRPGDSAIGTGEDAPDVFDKALKGVVADRAKRLNVDVADPISISRLPDQQGVARIAITYTHDGRQYPEIVTSDQLKNYARDPRGRTAGGPVTGP